MPAGEIKAKCLKVMDEVAKYRRTITITKHGKPVAKIVPLDLDDEQPASIFGCMADMVEITGDIESPPVPWTEWEIHGASISGKRR